MVYDPEYYSDGIKSSNCEQEFNVVISAHISSQAIFPIRAINKEEAIRILRTKVHNKELVPKVKLDYDTI